MTDLATQYAGFISYRRVVPDQRWARWLHRQLETFRLPQHLVQLHSLESPKLGRFFLDDAETAAEGDLSAMIRRCLAESESLIVVSSPRVRDAPWVNAEVDYYARMHPRRPILSLLIEGEPSESFPRSLVNDDLPRKQPLLEGGQPLAADVRRIRWWEPERRRLAVTKIAAAILGPRNGIDFDELWQRERRRIAQRRWFLFTSAGSVASVTGGLSWWGISQRKKADLEEERVRHVRAAEAIQEVSTLWETDSGQALSLLHDLERIPEQLRDFTWRYYHRVCRPFCKSVTLDDSAVTSLEFSTRSPGLLLTTNQSGAVHLWNMEDGHQHTLADAKHEVVGAAASVSGRWFAAAFGSGRVQIWDANDAYSSRFVEASGTLTALAFVDDILCVGSNKGIVAAWNVGTCDKLDEVQAAAPVYDLHAMPGGRLFGTGEVGILWVWRPGADSSLEIVGELDELHQVNAITSASGDLGTLVVTGGGVSVIAQPFTNARHPVRVWGMGDGFLRKGFLWELTGHEDSIRGLATIPSNGDYRIVSVSDDGSLRVWDLKSRGQTHNLTAKRRFLTCVACAADGRSVATGDTNGVIRVWDVGSRQAVRTASAPGVVPLRSLALCETANTFAVSDDIGRVRIWNVFPLQEVAELTAHGDVRRGLCFSRVGDILAAGTRNGSVQLWDISTRQLGRTLSTSLGSINALAFSADGLLAAGGNGGVMIWSSKNWEQEAAMPSFGEVNDVAFCDNERLLVLGAADGTVRAWDCRRRVVRRQISTQLGAIATLAVHPELPIAAVVGAGTSVELWNLSTGRLLRSIAGHRKAVRSVAFSPDGKTLASAGFDDRVILWDHDVGVKRTEFNCDEGTIREVRFAGAGDALIAAGGGEFGAIEHRIYAWDAVVR